MKKPSALPVKVKDTAGSMVHGDTWSSFRRKPILQNIIVEKYKQMKSQLQSKGEAVQCTVKLRQHFYVLTRLSLRQ